MNTENTVSAPPGKIDFRTAELVDLPSIVEIYNQAVPTHRSTANTTSVTVEGRKAWFFEHEPDKHPIFVAEVDGMVVGWCSLSVYRPGRFALRFTAEISCYIDNDYQGQGVGRELVRHALKAAPSLGIKNIVAVLIDHNEASRKMVEKLGFQQCGYLPRILDFDGQEYGEYYYGIRVAN
jgi:L-amino acid N-acyltransferase